MLTHLPVLKTCRSRMAMEWCTHCSCSTCNASFLISTNALQVASPVNRQKALSMFINLVRWVRTVHDQRLLPKHRHLLFKSMSRPSPYPGECDLSCNVSATLSW